MAGKRRVSVHREQWEMLEPFQITGHVFSVLDCIMVEISDGELVGRGEGTGVYYLDDTPDSFAEEVIGLAPEIERGLDRASLQRMLPPGGARNAIDCALWDLECKLAGKSIWEKTGRSVRNLLTCQTIGVLESPELTGRAAEAYSDYELLKIKLNDDRPIDRVRAVRSARPDARLIVDANQGFTLSMLEECLPEFAKCEVEMIEQPLPRGGDACLEGFAREIPLCADESCLHRGEMEEAARRYDIINIKLDKAGGLTEGLALADDIAERGLGVMVGNMCGTSLAMAPAYVVALQARYADLDGPTALKFDRFGGVAYENGLINAFTRTLWG